MILDIDERDLRMIILALEIMRHGSSSTSPSSKRLPRLIQALRDVAAPPPPASSVPSVPLSEQLCGECGMKRLRKKGTGVRCSACGAYSGCM